MNEMIVRLLGSYARENITATGGISSRNPMNLYTPNMCSILGAKYKNEKIFISRFATE